MSSPVKSPVQKKMKGDGHGALNDGGGMSSDEEIPAMPPMGMEQPNGTFGPGIDARAKEVSIGPTPQKSDLTLESIGDLLDRKLETKLEEKLNAKFDEKFIKVDEINDAFKLLLSDLKSFKASVHEEFNSMGFKITTLEESPATTASKIAEIGKEIDRLKVGHS